MRRPWGIFEAVILGAQFTPYFGAALFGGVGKNPDPGLQSVLQYNATVDPNSGLPANLSAPPNVMDAGSIWSGGRPGAYIGIDMWMNLHPTSSSGTGGGGNGWGNGN